MDLKNMKIINFDFRFFRLFFRTYRALGNHFQIKLLKETKGVEIWLFRRLSGFYWLHKKNCRCEVCTFQKYMFESDEIEIDRTKNIYFERW